MGQQSTDPVTSVVSEDRPNYSPVAVRQIIAVITNALKKNDVSYARNYTYNFD